MAVRVALQCEGADAMMILSEDNLAAERLRHSGQAVYNDQSGRIEGNQPFQVSYLNKATQLEILGGLERLPRLRESMHGGLEKPVIFDGHHKAVWDIKHVDAYLKELRSELATVPLLLLGESVSIEPALAIGLHRQAAQNLLLVGQDDENIAAVLNSMTSTFIHNDGTDVITNRHITVLDTSRDEDANVQRFVGRLQSNATSLQRVAITKIDDAIVNLHAILKDRLRMLDDDSISQEKLQFTPELLIVPHLGRARTLRRNEEFSFDDDGQIKVDKLFQDILRDGPSVAIHTCIGCDNANTVNRWLTRQSLHDFEYRVLMQMSVSDSNHLIDSAGANRLDKNVLLLYTESTGLVRKFRPYSFIFDK
jgi:S-DNA-T family DNA segregation ATPase FtsK/SpoIIIE